MNCEDVCSKIDKKLEDISVCLMKHEKKNFCLAKIRRVDWRLISYDYQNTTYYFIVAPSSAFKRFILDREYLNVVLKYPELFGCRDDWSVIKAIHSFERSRSPLLIQYSIEEYFEYIKGETMAYIFNVNYDGYVSDKILRLDLCRNINQDNVFQGGLLHVFKHFTPDGFETISSNGHEYETETFSDIYKLVIINFFLGNVSEDSTKNYSILTSRLKDGHILRGVYYKEENIPVSFISSMRID